MDADETETWKRALLRFRASKDEFMRLSGESPFNRSGRPFEALKYFEPDPAFHFPTKLVRYKNEPTLMMTTSRGTRQLFNREGRFEVTVQGRPVALQAYQSADRENPSLFVPFRDATAGKETYGSGRYLDLDVQHDDLYVLDFNYAYNPYCAYDEGYSCPIPPQENWLPVAVRAGEKKYHD